MVSGIFLEHSYNFTDKLILGNYSGMNVMASVGASNPIIMCIIALSAGLFIGSTVKVSQAHSKKDDILLKKL